MKIIRWSFVIPIFIFIGLTVAFTTIFFDTILKKILISSMQAITGAKVEIADVTTKFSNCSISISGLKCADKNDYFKNIADIDSIKFGVKFTPVLRKKFIIDEMSVTGFKTGTARKTSGELPKKEKKKAKEEKSEEPSKFSKLMDKAKTSASNEYKQLPAVNTFNEINSLIKNFDINTVIDKSNLNSIKQSQQFLADMQNRYDNYRKNFESFKINDKINNAKNIISELSNTKISGLSDITGTAKKVSELKTVKNDLDDIVKQLDKAKKDVSEATNLSGQIAEALNKDISSVSSKLSIPNMDLKNISSMVFGKEWVVKAEKAIYYINQVKQYIPKSSDNEDKKEEVKERLKGRDILFKQKQYPALLISNINISGTTAKSKDEQGINFSGIIKNISSSPSMVSQPITFDIKGNNGIQQVKLDGTFDHRTKKSSDIINFSFTGITGEILNIAENDYMPLINTADTKISGKFEMVNDDITAGANISFDNIKEKNLKDMNNDSLKLLAEITNEIKAFKVSAGIQFIQNDDFKLNIQSDIDKKLSNAISKTFSSKVKEAETKIKTELTKIVSAQTKEIEKTVELKKKELLAQIKKETGSIDDIKKSIEKNVSEKTGGSGFKKTKLF